MIPSKGWSILVKLMSKPSAWPYSTVSDTENVKHKRVSACHKVRDNSYFKHYHECKYNFNNMLYYSSLFIILINQIVLQCKNLNYEIFLHFQVHLEQSGNNNQLLFIPKLVSLLTD